MLNPGLRFPLLRAPVRMPWLPRDHWAQVNRWLDPERDYREITANLATREFPWDTAQALSFALFRTYAVPSIGRLLAGTGELTERTQKRYDDTGLLLEEILERGLDSEHGRTAVRRINQMHRLYDISDEDMGYVLATFVVTPARWLARFGYRPLTERELAASTHYYRELGAHLGIPDLPQDYPGFEALLDDYEAANFGFDPGARRVADATLGLLGTFFPFHLLPAALARRTALAVMDEPLLRAFDLPVPGRAERAVLTAPLLLRARLLRHFPARSRPKWGRDLGSFRSYPEGYRVADLGTFTAAPGCPARARRPALTGS